MGAKNERGGWGQVGWEKKGEEKRGSEGRKRISGGVCRGCEGELGGKA